MDPTNRWGPFLYAVIYTPLITRRSKARTRMGEDEVQEA